MPSPTNGTPASSSSSSASVPPPPTTNGHNGEGRGFFTGFGSLVANYVTSRLEAVQRWLDPRRSIAFECGHPEGLVSAETFQSLFEQEAIPARVVELLPKECFQVSPSIYEDENPDKVTAWEQAFAEMCDTLVGNSYHKQEQGSRFVEILRRADIQSGIGCYGVILIGLDDNRPLDQPAAMRAPRSPRQKSTPATVLAPAGQQPAPTAPTPTPTKATGTAVGSGGSGAATRNLTFLQVFSEYYCQVTEYDQNEQSPRFGMPTMYSITFGESGRYQGGVGVATKTVHWTRLVHLVDVEHQPPNNDTFGAPRQRPVLNRLLDLRKIYGPDAEGYYKNGIAGWSFETHPDLTLPATDRSELKDEWEKYTNSLDRLMASEGGTFKPMVTPVADPRSHIEVQIEAICIKLGCPVRIFKGSERGELASSQDDASWNDRIRSRQNTYLTPRVICPVIDRLIALGVLPEPEAEDGYKVWWPDLESQSKSEKADIALKETQAMAAYVSGDVRQLRAPTDWLTGTLGKSDDEAREIEENVRKHIEEALAVETEREIQAAQRKIAAGVQVDPQAKMEAMKQEATAAPSGQPSPVQKDEE